jgi:2-polyprenyl-3-methyl-5-hydroxy-6-metoxy-1,4-benzoquinol methylase/Flp pilus assembly protein TadD
MPANELTPPTEPSPSSQLQLKQEAQPIVLKVAATTVFYEAVAASLDLEQVVWDFGCGNGLGTTLLRREGRLVIGIDSAPPNVPEPDATSDLQFCATIDAAAKFGAPDVIVIADVLGYLQDPLAVLLALARASKPSTQLLLFEPRANVTQQLPLHKIRAYSALELVEATSLGGWTKQVSHELCRTFITLSADRAPTAAVEALTSGVATVFPDSVPLSTATHLAAAAHAIRNKNGEQASQLLISALQLTPTNTHALCGLARFAQVNQAVGDALHLLRQSLTLDPTNLQAMQLWLEFVAGNSPNDVLGTCQALANLAPTDSQVLTLLAQLHAQSGHVDLAIQDLELIRKQHPTPSADLSITLAWLLHSAGRNADAQVEARLAKLLAPDNPDVVELLGALAA